METNSAFRNKNWAGLREFGHAQSGDVMFRLFALSGFRALREALCFPNIPGKRKQKNDPPTGLLVLSNAGLSGIAIRLSSKYSQYKIAVIAMYGGLPLLFIGAAFFQGNGVSNRCKYSVGPNSTIYMFSPSIWVNIDGYIIGRRDFAADVTRAGIIVYQIDGVSK